MTALELYTLCEEAESGFQTYINQFLDDFRRADQGMRSVMVAEGPSQPGRIEGLIAAVVSALCREVSLDAPEWVKTVTFVRRSIRGHL